MWEGGGRGEGREKGERKDWQELGRVGVWRWRKGRYRSREEENLHLGSHFRVGKRLGSRGDPRCPWGCHQLGPWAAEQRGPELALPHYHTDDYLGYHHRIFVQRQMEIETETLIRATN